MKKSTLLILFITLIAGQQLAARTLNIQANDSLKQDSISQPTFIQIIETPRGFNFWEQRFKGNWAGVFFSINGLDKPDYSMYPESQDGFMEPKLWHSNCLSINPIQASLSFQRNRNFIGMVTGLGFDFQSYSLDQGVSLKKGTDMIEPVYLSHETNRKSKFASIYMTVPVLIEFQIPVNRFDNRIYFSAGIISSVRLDTHTKVKFREDKKKQKLKETGDYYLRDVRFSGTVRLGYRWINLFATYDIQPLFRDDRGPVLYPYSFGLAFITF